MATRHYAVVGELSSPRDDNEYREFSASSDFENYVYDQLKKHESLKLAAIEQQDELSRKRSPATWQKFTFRVTGIDKYGGFHVSVTDKEKHWIQIQTNKDGASFAIFD